MHSSLNDVDVSFWAPWWQLRRGERSCPLLPAQRPEIDVRATWLRGSSQPLRDSDLRQVRVKEAFSKQCRLSAEVPLLGQTAPCFQHRDSATAV